MFIYLSKKIAIPNGVKLKSLSWNLEHGWIACGGENGLLKVLKLESQSGKDSRAKGVAAPSNLSMNQTLEGHNGAVMCTTWNPHYRKLTTSDQYGLIIVWMLHKGMWFEEMINNRNKSVVRDMKWKFNGQEICIIYEDGAVIVGSVDGNRLWGKELKTKLAFVEWSPDGRSILFVTVEGEVHLYNSYGNKIGSTPLYAIEDSVGAVQIIGIHWYDGAEGYSDPSAPSLAIAFENGRVQVMRSEADEEPVLIDTGMRLTQCRWNSNGTTLALGGSQTTTLSSGEQRDVSQVQFYTPFGIHVRTLKIPGSGIGALSWEGGGLRIAFAVDSYVYFANIRPDYKWGSFGNTVVYAFNKPDRAEQCVVFWDTSTGEKYTKYVKKLMSIHAAGENCVLATGSAENSNQFILILCNAIGAPVDSKYIDIQPTQVTMTENHVIAANDDSIYVWQYRTSVSMLTSVDATTGGSLRRKEGRERVFHIDDASTDADVKSPMARSTVGTSDVISCLAATDRYLLVGRASGTVHRYTLPHISLTDKFVLRCRPAKLAVNCDNSRMAIIDINGILSFFDLDTKRTDASGAVVTGEHLEYERKDAWDMLFSRDNPKLFAVMEKTRMYIFRDLDPEEPVLSSGFMAEFTDLRIRSVLLDEIMAQPDHPEKSMVIDYESRSLRDARHLLSSNRIPDAMQFIEDNSHPRLWRLLAETALEQLDFGVCEKAFVRCVDYQGIQFVKRLRKLDDPTKQKAEVAVYFQRFDEAESLYREIDRKDLAVELRMRLGDWFRVVQLVQTGGGDDDLLQLAWDRIGDYYADRQKHAKAVQYYTQAKNAEALVDCFYILEDFDNLEALTYRLPEGSPLLQNIGLKLQSVGLSEAAVNAFLKAGDVKAAVDCCVLLNQWDQAVELAETHEFPQIEGLLGKYASHLLSTGKMLAAIELYRKANKATDSAMLLAKMALEVVESKVKPLRAKRLYVLAALEVERHRKRTMDMTAMTAATIGGTTRKDTATATAATLETLLKADASTTEDAAAARTLDNAWHGAEALHFFLLAQRQLYDGSIDAAMKTSLRLANYEDILEPKDIYSLIALTSFYNQYYAQASRAFIKLESLDTLTDKQREAYRDLGLSIFITHSPVDPGSRTYPCPNRDCSTSVHDWDTSCMKCGTRFQGCTVTGRAILDSNYFRCRTCRHKAYKSEMRTQKNCALCHAPLGRTTAGAGAGPSIPEH